MRKLCLIIPFLLLVSGCASSYKFTPAKGMAGVTLSSRAVLPKIGSESDKELKDKGYVYIGDLYLEDEIKSCWGDDCKNFECPAGLSPKDMTKEFLDRAASHGGDLLVYRANAQMDKLSTSKEGACLQTMQKTIQVAYCCKFASGYCQSTCFRDQTTTQCVRYASINGKKCAFVTAGYIWRYDPVLAEKQRETEKKRFEKEQRYEALKEERERKLVYTPRKKAPQKKVETPKDQQDRIAALEKAYKFYEFQKNDLKSVSVGGKYGFQDKSGKMVIEPQFTDTTLGFPEGEEVATVAVGRDKGKRWGIIDKKGQWVLQPTYEQTLSRPSNGMIRFLEKDKCGYLNTKGDVVITARFSNCWDFTEGMAAVRQEIPGYFGYINKAGQLVIAPLFDWCHNFSEGMAAVKVKGKYGYIDHKGNIVIEPQFDDAKYFVGGIARVRQGIRKKYITTDGDVYMEQ